ncbi:MAG TPA: hypothetical protein VF487_09935 [Chitinophagaceae bacterium]
MTDLISEEELNREFDNTEFTEEFNPIFTAKKKPRSVSIIMPCLRIILMSLKILIRLPFTITVTTGI